METWASQAELDADIAAPHAADFLKVFNFILEFKSIKSFFRPWKIWRLLWTSRRSPLFDLQSCIQNFTHIYNSSPSPFPVPPHHNALEAVQQRKMLSRVGPKDVKELNILGFNLQISNTLQKLD